MTDILHRRNDQSMISRYAYGYDNAGRRIWVLRANGRGDVYRYDATDQLTNVLYEALNPHGSPTAWTNEARYAFDPAGNRTSVTLTNSGTVHYTANALNQYTAVGNVTPTYDANGNLTWDGRWSYSYDRENRLVQAANDQMTINYRYDAFNRLVERVAGTAVVRYYYDDRWRLVAEYDGSGNLLAKYVYGPGIDEPVRMTRGGAHYYYHAAALGTVTEMTDATGNVVERYGYDVYGEPTIYDAQSSILIASAIGNRLLFQGRDLDPDTGLYRFRNGSYLGRWGRHIHVTFTTIAEPLKGLRLATLSNPALSSGNDPVGARANDHRHGEVECYEIYEDCLRNAGLERAKCFARAAWPTFGVAELAIIAGCAIGCAVTHLAFPACMGICVAAFTTINLAVLICKFKKCDRQYEAAKKACEEQYDACLRELE